MVYEATISGNINTVKWINSRMKLVNTDITPAVRYGYIDIINYLINIGIIPDERTMWNA